MAANGFHTTAHPKQRAWPVPFHEVNSQSANLHMITGRAELALTGEGPGACKLIWVTRVAL